MNARFPVTPAAGAFLALAAALALAVSLTGCAVGGPAELPPSSAPPPPAAEPAHRAQAPSAVGPDTTPSPEALAVLASIPEAVPGGGAGNKAVPPAPRPLTLPQPVPSPTPAPVPVDTTHVPAPADTAPADSASAPTDNAGVPVPEPTKPLGAAPALPPTPEPPAVSAPPPPVVSAPAAPAAPVVDDSGACWRLQVGAPAERARGRVLRDASQSLLMVPMTVALDAGRWKVRSRECYPRLAAESLRDRATASGFKGVFLVRFAAGR